MWGVFLNSNNRIRSSDPSASTPPPSRSGMKIRPALKGRNKILDHKPLLAPQFLGTSAIRRQEQPQAQDSGQRRDGKYGQRDQGHAGEMALDAGVQQGPDAERDRRGE